MTQNPNNLPKMTNKNFTIDTEKIQNILIEIGKIFDKNNINYVEYITIMDGLENLKGEIRPK